MTPQISKVTERCLGRLLQPFLESSGAFGPNQFAYTKGRGARDALALNVLTWVLLGSGHRIALYCSDVSGAFDRVSAKRLVQKMRGKGVHASMLRVLQSWLDDRRAVVIVDGAASLPEPLTNSVYQGTVLGPPLWNCYYEDARWPVNAEGFTETVFADDLQAYKAFKEDVGDAELHAQMGACQSSLHAWGRANQVAFDAAKESFHIILSPAGRHLKITSSSWAWPSTPNW